MEELAKETNTFFLLYSISNLINFRVSSLVSNNNLENCHNLIDFNEGLLKLLSEIKVSNINIKISLDEIILNYFLN
jgi:hypothetical protein